MKEYQRKQQELSEEQERLEKENKLEEKKKKELQAQREKIEKETMKLAKKIVAAKEKKLNAEDKARRKEEKMREKMRNEIARDSARLAEQENADLERFAKEDAEDEAVALTKKQQKALKRIQEKKRKLLEQTMRDSILLADGDFDLATGKRDNSDLPEDVRQRVEPKKNEEEVVLDDENSFAFASGELDSTYMANIDSFAVDEEEATLVTSMIDSVLLQQQIAELEGELQNVRDIKELERNKNRKGDVILRKIKIPNCRYLNDVYYVRDKFEFRYEYDFFLHYFDHRYFHRKKFYDIDDSTRIVAKYVMQLVGRSKYRHTDFNKVADSVATILPNYPVVEYLDSVITQLNLEYLATGEIKIKYKGRRQDRILSKILPTKINDEGGGSLGNIKFYTSNRRRIIEELDASQYDSLLIKPDSLQLHEKHLADSINAVLSKMQEQDSLQRIQDSLALLTNELAMDGSSKDSLHQMLDDMLFAQNLADSTAQDSTSEEDVAPQQPDFPIAPSDAVSLNDIGKYIKMLEAQRKDGNKKGNQRQSSGLGTPSVPFSSRRPSSILDNLNAGATNKPDPPATTPTSTPAATAPRPSEPEVQPSESTEPAQEEGSSRRRRSRRSKDAEEQASSETENAGSSNASESQESVSEDEEQSSKKKKSRKKRRSSDEEDSSSEEGSPDNAGVE